MERAEFLRTFHKIVTYPSFSLFLPLLTSYFQFLLLSFHKVRPFEILMTWWQCSGVWKCTFYSPLVMKRKFGEDSEDTLNTILLRIYQHPTIISAMFRRSASEEVQRQWCGTEQDCGVQGPGEGQLGGGLPLHHHHRLPRPHQRPQHHHHQQQQQQQPGPDPLRPAEVAQCQRGQNPGERSEQVPAWKIICFPCKNICCVEVAWGRGEPEPGGAVVAELGPGAAEAVAQVTERQSVPGTRGIQPPASQVIPRS